MMQAMARQQCWWLLLLWLVGCAGLGTPHAPSDGASGCLPEGVSRDFLNWPITWASEGIVQGMPVVAVLYQLWGKAVLVFWARGILILVDPAPSTASLSGWRRDLSKPCAWRQVQDQVL